MLLTGLRARLIHGARLGVDVALSAAAFFTVTILPLLQSGNRDPRELMLPLGIYALMSVLALYVTRSYCMIWRYVGFRDFLRLIAAAGLTVTGFIVFELLFLNPNLSVPGTLLFWTVLLVWIANVGFLAAPRFLARAFDEARAVRGHDSNMVTDGNLVLLTGEVTRMDAFIRECDRGPAARYRVVGVLTDDTRLHGSYLHGVKVLGAVDDLKLAISHLEKQGRRPQTLVLADDGAVHTDIERILELANAAHIRIGRLPARGTFTDDSPIRPIELSDLLGRPEIKIDMGAVASMVEGKCVMVTGAGGSIGSELSRQIAALKPSRLVVLDASEFNLYSIDGELAERFPQIARETALVDVRDAALISHWIGRTRPSIVFHAAALKHVPLLEDHPIEGIKTNVFGTINVAEACRTHRVAAMVTISTDKAVNPTNVMGATKRLAEAYCQGMDQTADANAATRFVIVRFGNVLGSAGSVVPLFRRQIEAGGPVTVTHADITRYFMTIPEAVTLVMMAGAQGLETPKDRSHIYLLDMGAPVKIIDLARQMIRLFRHPTGPEIKVEIIGLRPGEKLYEELSHTEEMVEATRSPSILKLAPRATDLRIIRQQVQELRQACSNEDRERTLRLLKISVPDYVTDAIQAALHS